MMSITDSSRAPTPQRGPSTTPLPTFTRRLGISACTATPAGPTSITGTARIVPTIFYIIIITSLQDTRGCP